MLCFVTLLKLTYPDFTLNLADIDKNLSDGRYFDAIMQIQPLLNELNETHEPEWESNKADSLPREQELLSRLVHSLLSLDMGMQAAPHVIRLSQLQELDGKPDVAVKTLQQGIDHDPGCMPGCFSNANDALKMHGAAMNEY